MTDADLAKTMVEIMPRFTRLIRTFMAAAPDGELTLPQLRTLARLSHRDQSNSELAKSMGVSIPAMSRMVEGLVRRGLIKRTPLRRDRRIILLTMTAQGRKVFNRTKAHAQKNLIAILAPLSPHDKNTLKQALTTLAELSAHR